MEYQFLNVPPPPGGGSSQDGDDGDDSDDDTNLYQEKQHPQQKRQQPSPRSIDEYLDFAYHQSTSSNSLMTQSNSSHNNINTNNNIHHCRRRLYQLFDPSLFQHNNWRYYIIFLALGIANSGDSSEMGCTSYILSSVTFQHDILMSPSTTTTSGGIHENDTAADGGGISSSYISMIAGSHMAGMLASGLLAGIVADIRGRRYTLLLGLVNNSIVGILSSLVQTAFQLCILRFITGVGLGFVIAGVVTLSAEISPPCRRGRYMTLVASCYTLGYLYTALWAILIFHVGSGNWRVFLFVNAVPTMIATALVYMFAPESPRYYMCRGKLNEAVKVANFIASRMGYGKDDAGGDDGRGENNVMLTEAELRRYIFESKRIGMMSFRSKEVILRRGEVAAAEGTSHTSREWGVESAVQEGGDDLLREIWTNLSTIKQVFVDGHWKTTVPLQLSYLSLTLITGTYLIRYREIDKEREMSHVCH